MLTDLRHTLRFLRRSPLISLAAILTLAIGTGAATAAIAVVRGVLLAPLDYPDSYRLVRLYQTLDPLRESPNPRLAAIWNRLPLSYLNAADLRRESRALTDLGLFYPTTVVLDEGEPRDVAAARVQPELMRTLAVEPFLGRIFTAAETLRGERLVLLDHGLWLRVFGADAQVLGRKVRLDGEPHTVVGVMPLGFVLPGREDELWIPLTPSDEDLAQRDNYFYAAIGRLASGKTLANAGAELDLWAAKGDVRPGEAGGGAGDEAQAGIRAVPLIDTVVGDSRRLVHLLVAAAVVVLLIACANVTHLLLAQEIGRRRELALCLALGASRWRLSRRLLIESTLLALAGAAGGWLLARLAVRGLALLAADELPRIEGVVVDGLGALLTLVAVGLFSALAISWLPLFQSRTVTPGQGLEERPHGGAGGLGAHGGLVVAQVALSSMLAAGAVVLASSWQYLASVDPGFETRRIWVQEMRLPAWLYPDPMRRQELADRLLTTLEALPGVRGAALTSRLPKAGPVEVWGFRIAGLDAEHRDWTAGRSAAMHFATPDYFDLLGIPIIAGRPFFKDSGKRDGQGRREVLVNQRLAERHWPDGQVVGAELVMGRDTYHVVGVVADVRQLGLAEEPGEWIFQPISARSPDAFAVLVAVSEAFPVSQLDLLRSHLRRLDPGLPLPPATSLEAVLAEAEPARQRSRALLVALLAGAALSLTVVGTYGVMAYSVSLRRREIGIRMALGADASRIRRSFIRRTLGWALAGVALGSVGALAAGRLLQGLLWGVRASQPSVLLGVAALSMIVCLMAGYLPSHRASRVQPAPILRGE